MKKTDLRKKLSFILCIVLIAAMALFTTGCNDNQEVQTEVAQTEVAQTEVAQTEEARSEVADSEMAAEPEVETDGSTAEADENAETGQENSAQEPQNVGEGNTSFAFSIVDEDGNEFFYEVHTDKETVGEALLDNGLIAGEQGDYGLYVKEVGGMRADFEKDGAYWSFYVDDAYAMSGVDMTKIETGKKYTFKYEKQ